MMVKTAFHTLILLLCSFNDVASFQTLHLPLKSSITSKMKQAQVTATMPLLSSSTSDFDDQPSEDNNNDNNNNNIGNVDDEEIDDISSSISSLLRIASSTGRGEFATPEQKADALMLIEKLEGQNPTLKPTSTDSDSENNDDNGGGGNNIYGTWELLYSSTQLFRSSPFFMAGRAVCSTPDEAKQYDWFCDMHRAALAISNIGTVRQIITQDNKMISEFEVKVGSVPFLSDFVPLAAVAKYSGGLPLTIDGAIVSTADLTPTVDGKSWELFMDTVEIKGSNVPLLRQLLDTDNIKLKSRDLGSFLESNVQGYTNPKPIFTTTYLNDNIRISRDQDGKVFVYGKTSNNDKPTDYSNVDSDLGLLRLLEGFNDSVTKYYI